ncbi:hypothetical protein [Porphyromonas levii]|uniref:hypothetical protein n=1 Tax=Porphyromonas levii TaxID=28114 RepID=UPI00036CC7E3|nr:hypothetical protein [Porphyromonas levii]MBR8704131.1 hypothetical protein [Porphyromonas levii]MBR8730156.1 hypothetical protein [Porphyromonas levii]MBR8732334.1 hypothetical protein [Porphyromonas levii]MBR8760548.1 hypothetical protein [Porphyromonas levii]MBR8766361.1 hypothetical protein [Porphyromonas levii]
MNEKLNKEALQSIKGGERAEGNMCGELQESASRHGRTWTEEQWDKWCEAFYREC